MGHGSIFKIVSTLGKYLVLVLSAVSFLVLSFDFQSLFG